MSAAFSINILWPWHIAHLRFLLTLNIYLHGFSQWHFRSLQWIKLYHLLPVLRSSQAPPDTGFHSLCLLTSIPKTPTEWCIKLNSLYCRTSSLKCCHITSANCLQRSTDIMVGLITIALVFISFLVSFLLSVREVYWPLCVNRCICFLCWVWGNMILDNCFPESGNIFSLGSLLWNNSNPQEMKILTGTVLTSVHPSYCPNVT